jgi:hypothetical protein
MNKKLVSGVARKIYFTMKWFDMKNQFLLLVGFSMCSVLINAQPTFEKLPARTQAAFKTQAATFRHSPVSYEAVSVAVKNLGIDLSTMTFEDAISLMLSLVAGDAKKDLDQLNKDLEELKKQKEDMRKKRDLLNKSSDSLKRLMQMGRHSDSLQLKIKTAELKKLETRERQVSGEERALVQKIAEAEKRKQVVEEEIKKLKAGRQ